MALVRKTAKLKDEIVNRLSTITAEKINILYKKHKVDVSITTMFNLLLQNGRIYDPKCLEHYAGMLDSASSNALAITARPVKGKVNFSLCSEKGQALNGLAQIDLCLTSGVKRLPQIKAETVLMGFHTDMIHFVFGQGRFGDFGPHVAFNFFDSDNELEGVQTRNTIASAENSFKNCLGRYPKISVEQFEPAETKALEELEMFRIKVDSSVRRIEAVRTYVMGKLWPVCSSLNGMVKHFPGILEYVSDDTLKRFQKNAPRNATVDPALVPDANVLAATAEVKLKR